MPSPPAIGPALPPDEPYLWALWEDAFMQHMQRGSLYHRMEGFSHDLAIGRVSVARVGGKPVGFGVVERLGSASSVHALLRAGDRRGLTAQTRRWLGGAARHEHTVRRYPGTTNWGRLLTGSAFFTAMAVDPDHRRKGIGTALAQYRVDRALQSRCPAAFVTCVAGSGSDRLFDALGFECIVEVTPFYPDGSGTVLMGRVLGE